MLDPALTVAVTATAGLVLVLSLFGLLEGVRANERDEDDIPSHRGRV